MNTDNRLRLSEAKNLFRQALQRQNERAAGMKMPDDMEQRVMGSLTPNPSPRRGEPSPLPLRRSPLLWRGLGGGCIAVAASVLLLILLNVRTQQAEQPPVIAEIVTEPQDSTEETHATAPTVVTEQKQPAMAQAEKPKLTRRQKPTVRKETIAEPPAEEAVPMETPAEGAFPEDRLLNMNNPYLIAAAQLQDVRERGERLDREVAMLMNRQ
jgi:hypothetical protein